MRRFVEGVDREQATLFPENLEDWIDQDNPVRAIDAFIEKLDLSRLGFDGVAPATSRVIFGYLMIDLSKSMMAGASAKGPDRAAPYRRKRRLRATGQGVAEGHPLLI